MTPLARFLSRFLPGPLIAPALALAYAAMAFGLLVAGDNKAASIHYIDVRGMQ